MDRAHALDRRAGRAARRRRARGGDAAGRVRAGGARPRRQPRALDPGWRSIPRALRAAAVDAVYNEGPRRAIDDAALDALAECDLARRDRGGPDLRFLGALLCFRRTDRYRWLVEREGSTRS
ncbi:MAG: hypothetical protein M5U28_04650 [Sandaracinaceae bacterium]|nr:hypothetical protein [Sandaracinaceae bacterium]